MGVESREDVRKSEQDFSGIEYRYRSAMLIFCERFADKSPCTQRTRRFTLKRLALLLMFSAALYGDGFDGWGRVKWGSTKAQVLEEYKAEGAVESEGGVRIPEYRVGEDTFSLVLGFDPDGLSRVLLTPKVGPYTEDDKDIRKMITLHGIGLRIDHLLEDKYGTPSKSARSLGDIPKISDEWLLNGGNITFLMGYARSISKSGKDGIDYRVRLMYERKPKALDKL